MSRFNRIAVALAIAAAIIAGTIGIAGSAGSADAASQQRFEQDAVKWN